MEKVEFEVSAAESDSGIIQQINFSAIVPTLKDAQAIAATFPKYLNVKACTITTGDYSGCEWRGVRGYVSLNASLVSNGVNKGINEGGLKRARKFASLTSYKVVQPYQNAASAKKIEAMLKGVR